MCILSFPLHLFIVPLVLFLLALTSRSPLPCFQIFPSLHFAPSSLSYFSIPLFFLCSCPQFEIESDPRGLAQCGRGLPLQRCHHLQDRPHCHPETGLLQRLEVTDWLLTLLLNPSSPSPPQYQVKWRWRGGSGMSSQSPLTHKPTTAGNLLKAVSASQQAANPISLLCRAGVLKVGSADPWRYCRGRGQIKNERNKGSVEKV